MKEVLDDLESGRYKRIMVKSNSIDDQDKEEVVSDKMRKSHKNSLMDNSLKNHGEI
jgi:hypothetical protein